MLMLIIIGAHVNVALLTDNARNDERNERRSAKVERKRENNDV